MSKPRSKCIQMNRRQIKIQRRILPALQSVSEVFLNYTKQDQYIDTFITSQKQNDIQKLMPASVRGIFTVALDYVRAGECQSSG
jgi:hypothetical protein